MSLRNYIFIVLFFWHATSTAADSIHTKKSELSRINNQIERLQKTLEQDQEQQQTTQQQLKTAELMLNKLNQQLTHYNKALSEEQSDLSELKTTQETAMQKLSHQRIALAEQFRAAYQLGQAQSLKIIFNYQDPNILARHLTYYRYLSEKRLALISEIKHTVNSLASNVSAINQHQQNLKLLLSQKQQQQHEQLRMQAHHQKLITALNQSVQSKQQQINNLIADQKSLQQLISQLQNKIEQPIINNASFNMTPGKLNWPVKGTLAARFGSALDVGDQHLNGVIIKAPEGTPVHAVSSGKVIFANWLRGFGLLIIVNHGNNYMSLYARNQTLYAKVGDTVGPADTIATTGRSGGYSQSGLYFELRKNGTPINPATWCR